MHLWILCISGLGYITFCLILSHNIMRPPYLCKFMAGFRGSSMNSSHPAEMNLIQVKLSFRKRRTFLSCVWGGKWLSVGVRIGFLVPLTNWIFLWLSRGSSLVIVYCLCLNGHPISTEMTADPHQRLLRCRGLPAHRWMHTHTKAENSTGLLLTLGCELL